MRGTEARVLGLPSEYEDLARELGFVSEEENNALEEKWKDARYGEVFYAIRGRPYGDVPLLLASTTVEEYREKLKEAWTPQKEEANVTDLLSNFTTSELVRLHNALPNTGMPLDRWKKKKTELLERLREGVQASQLVRVFNETDDKVVRLGLSVLASELGEKLDEALVENSDERPEMDAEDALPQCLVNKLSTLTPGLKVGATALELLSVVDRVDEDGTQWGPAYEDVLRALRAVHPGRSSIKSLRWYATRVRNGENDKYDLYEVPDKRYKRLIGQASGEEVGGE